MAAGGLLAACAGSLGEQAVLTAPTAPAPVQRAPPVRDGEHAKLVATYGGVYEDQAVANAVAALVGRLVAASDEPHRSFDVTILDSPVVNAFALPSGDLFITRGLIALANDESELSAVIAHEIAHVTADHASRRQEQARAAALARRVSEVVQDPGFRALTRETADLSVATFSQQQEFQADELGIQTLVRAGLDPFAAGRFLTSMAEFAALPALQTMRSAEPGFLSSHPSTPARVAHARRIAATFGDAPHTQDRGEAYLRTLDGMRYGDDPSEGVVRGRRFTHADFGIAFTVPDGYTLKNTASAVLATDGEHTAIRFDPAVVASTMSLTDYLRSGWVKGLISESVRSLTVNGRDAATASALVDGWSFRIGVVRGPRQVYRFIFASSQPASAYEAAFGATLRSFQLLSPSERGAVRPLSLRIVRVGPADTPATLAARMSGVERRMRMPLFLALNGLGERTLEPGDLVKIVVD